MHEYGVLLYCIHSQAACSLTSDGFLPKYQ
jgi:hypothetical protein